MKVIRYQVASGEVNCGTEESPILEPILITKERYSDEANFERSYAIAQAEAYNGEIRVEEVPDLPHEPTAEERITALEEQMILADNTAIELFEAQLAQEEINAAQDVALIEIYEMMGGE